jgi:Uncharacterised nucleotidyltransferase
MKTRPVHALAAVLLQPALMANCTLAEWDVLIRCARKADLLARLAVLLREEGLWETVPEGPRRHLRSGELLCERQQAELNYEVQDLSAALQGVGEPVVMLKGAAYILAGLRAARGRMISDVDILVPRRVLHEAEAALMMAGWMSAAKSAYDQRYYRQWMHELPPMWHIRRGTVLDVHHAIMPTTARLHPSSERLLADARPLHPGGNLHVLAPVDMVLHSATHLMHEGEFEMGLRGLVDLHALLVEFGVALGFWDRLVCRAVELQLARPLFYALRQLRRQLGYLAPPEVVQALVLVPGARPGPLVLCWMDAMFGRVLSPQDAQDASGSVTGLSLAQYFMYVRGHWLRMPPGLLAWHLLRKALVRAKSDEASTN